MSSNMTLWEVLQAAIQKEVMSRFLYVGLRQRVKNPAAREAFRLLADEEQAHQQVLEDLLHGKLREGALSNGVVVDYKITDCLEQPEISPTMELKEVFQVAARKEKAAHDLYMNLAAIYPNGQVRRLLEDLAVQELEHKKSVEDLYNEVAFPQTDGG